MQHRLGDRLVPVAVYLHRGGDHFGRLILGHGLERLCVLDRILVAWVARAAV